MAIVQECTEAEAAAVLEKHFGQSRTRCGFKLSGWIDAVAHNAKTGAVEWEIHQPNIITDFGRRRFATYTMWTLNIFSSPSTEAAAVRRYGLFDNGNASSSQLSGALTPTYDAGTLTKTYQNTFAVPAANRQIGTIGLGDRSANFGIFNVLAYSLISPVKTQSTLQTLEVSYRIIMLPIY